MMTGGTIVIGDSGMDGWATFVVYLATAAFCAFNARESIERAGDRSRSAVKARTRSRFWGTLAIMTLLLGLTRQLDLQALLTTLARRFLDADGLYDAHAGLQLALVIAIGVFGAVALFSALFAFRRVEKPTLAGVAGAVLLFTFTLIRTVGLGSVDHVLHEGRPHAQVNNLIEIGALLIILGANYAFLRRLRGEGENARLRALALQECRRRLGEKRRMA